MEILRADGHRVSVATMLQAAEMDGLTGVLVLPTGRVFVRDGEVVDAACGSLEGREAYFELLIDPITGEMVFHEEDVESHTALGPGPAMLLEAARRADEWARFAERAFEVRPDADVDARFASVERLLDGKTALHLVVSSLGTSRHGAAHLAAQALSMGRWADRGQAQPLPEPDDGVSLLELLERGRGMLRTGRLAEACALFERACRRDPDHNIAAQNLRIARKRLGES